MENSAGIRPRMLLLTEYDRVGGTRTYAKQLVAFYAQNNFDLTILAKGPADDPDMAFYCQSFGVRLLRHEEVAGGDFRFSGRPWHLKKERRTLNAFIAELCPHVVVASVGTPGLFLGHMGKGRRSIYILHTYPQPSQVGWRRLLSKLIWSVLTPADIRFVTVSQFARERMLHAWGFWRRNIDVSVMYSSTGSPVLAPKSNNGHVCVLTVGHVVDYKNPLFWIDVAARAVNQLPALKFVWVGPGPLLEKCRQRVASLGLQEKVLFTDAATDMDKYYQNCDIYLQPSKIESLGLSVLDAMRYGKPAVVTNVGGLPELVRNGETGWVVDLADEQGLNRCIVNLAKDPGERDRMGRNAQATYASRFSPDQWSREMRLVHDSLLLKR